jgi:hypothetical protein
VLADTTLRTNSAGACPSHPVLTGAGSQIEDEMAKTQKNKATSYHLGASLASTCHVAPATLCSSAHSRSLARLFLGDVQASSAPSLRS